MVFVFGGFIFKISLRFIVEFNFKILSLWFWWDFFNSFFLFKFIVLGWERVRFCFRGLVVGRDVGI